MNACSVTNMWRPRILQLRVDGVRIILKKNNITHSLPLSSHSTTNNNMAAAPGALSTATPGSSPNASHDLEPQHVLILYASETGNAQDLAERTARAFRAAHRRAVCLSMDDYDVADLPHEPLIILITSTHGRGDPPQAMRGLWGKLIRKGLPDDILDGELRAPRNV